MALTKITYVDNVTVIGAQNLNDIQDEVIANGNSISTLSSGKVDKVQGKGLSTNDFTNDQVTKLAGIENGATNTPVDNTLTHSGQAADAKKTGDTFDNHDGRLDTLEDFKTDMTAKYNPDLKDPTMTLPVGRDANGKLWAAGNTGVERFGVSGVGGSSPTLTRLWDAAGLTATPGTDQAAGSSGFDKYPVFNRKKCVGSWSVVNSKAVFTPQAYYGDADYAEDGTMGDYVCVDVLPTYWYHDEENGILGVSGSAASGWEPHPVCVDGDGNVRQHTYLPCYALALKDGHAVSLPGYQNYFGCYKDNWDQARTYGDGTSFANYAIIEPSAVDHYEWLMQTIEFATQNMQTVMNGAVSMRYAADAITAAPAANKIVVTAAIGGNFVVGQSIYIGAAHGDSPSAKGAAYNCITAIQNCDENGTLNESGTYRLITYDGTDRTGSITAGTTVVASRPWITGATQGYASGVSAVLGHTGSPISNSSGKYPMLYRWRENTYGNQNMTCLDLMNKRVAVGESDYKLQWFYNPYLQHQGAAKYYPSSTSKPDATDLSTEANGWEQLGTETPVAGYKDGYIKEEGFDAEYPHVRVPVATGSPASATTYYCDYAYLVASRAVRAVRRRGYLNSGAYYGPRFVHAVYAPSYAFWSYGSGLFFAQ